MDEVEPLSIAIVGAGAIGCYVGGMLRAAGHPVVFIGRDSMSGALAASGLSLRTIDGTQRHVAPGDIHFETDPAAAAAARYALICVKSTDTAATGADLRRELRAGTAVVSLQNGVDNPQTLSTELDGPSIHAGMVAFNVVRSAGTTFAAATEGGIHLENGPEMAALAAALSAAGIATTLHDDMGAVQWSKLLLNLNNALNALSGLPLAEQLRDRRWRKIFAQCVSEALAVMSASGVQPVRIGKVRPQLIPLVLRLPDFLFERVASRMLKVDPQARSSMVDDYTRGRPSEIDHLNGAVVAYGATAGVDTPVNAAVCAAAKRLFARQIEPPVDPATLG